MAVKLRLARMGRLKKPVYRVIAADSKSRRDGLFIEKLGIYNPVPNPAIIEVNEDRINYWLDCGAIPTDTVYNLLRSSGILHKRTLTLKGNTPEKVAEEMAIWKARKDSKKSTAKVAEKPKVEATVKAEKTVEQVVEKTEE